MAGLPYNSRPGELYHGQSVALLGMEGLVRLAAQKLQTLEILGSPHSGQYHHAVLPEFADVWQVYQNPWSEGRLTGEANSLPSH